MIITAGKYKGKKIKTVKNREVRPTSAKIRESIFNIIQTSIVESTMLDLFAGSGIMGLEALSRGAAKVVYVEKSSQITKLLKENLTGYSDEIELMLTDALVALDRLKGQAFNIIFVDPPYAADLIGPVLKKIKENNLLAEEGIIIIEHASSKSVSEIVEELNFSISKEKIYGGTAITIVG